MELWNAFFCIPLGIEDYYFGLRLHHLVVYWKHFVNWSLICLQYSYVILHIHDWVKYSDYCFWIKTVVLVISFITLFRPMTKIPALHCFEFLCERAFYFLNTYSSQNSKTYHLETTKAILSLREYWFCQSHLAPHFFNPGGLILVGLSVWWFPSFRKRSFDLWACTINFGFYANRDTFWSHQHTKLKRSFINCMKTLQSFYSLPKCLFYWLQEYFMLKTDILFSHEWFFRISFIGVWMFGFTLDSFYSR